MFLTVLMLSGCKSDKAKAFSDGCNLGAYGGVAMVGLQPPPGVFKEQCDKLAQKYVGGDAEMKKALETMEATTATNAAPSPDGK